MSHALSSESLITEAIMSQFALYLSGHWGWGVRGGGGGAGRGVGGWRLLVWYKA